MLIIVIRNDKNSRNNNNKRQKTGKEMYRSGGGSKAVAAEMGHVVADRKRINDALDKHLERSSPSTSATTTTVTAARALNGKDHHRSSMFKTADHHFKDAKCTDGFSFLLLSFINYPIMCIFSA